MIDVAAVEDLKEGKPVIVRVKGRDLALVQWRGEVFAVRNVCPHQSESFTTGHARPELIGGARPGEIDTKADEPVLVCPVHKWTYKLRTGQCSVDARLRVRTYPVTITDGRVFVDTSRRESAAAASE